MRFGDCLDHGETESRTGPVFFVGLDSPCEQFERVLLKRFGQTRSLIDDPQGNVVAVHDDIDTKLARVRMALRIINQRKQGLANARHIQTRFPRGQTDAEGKASLHEAWLNQPRKICNLTGDIHLLPFQTQLPALDQTYDAQILHQSGQAVDLFQEPAKQRFVRNKHAVDDAKHSTTQDGKRRAQLMGNLGIPVHDVAGALFKANSHTVEVCHEGGGFTRQIIVTCCPGTQITTSYASRCLRN